MAGSNLLSASAWLPAFAMGLMAVAAGGGRPWSSRPGAAAAAAHRGDDRLQAAEDAAHVDRHDLLVLVQRVVDDLGDPALVGGVV